MILIQQNDASNPKVASTRAIYTKIIGDKHEDAMAKFGAAVSQGLIDAGGRNVTISLTNTSGGKNREAIVGMALFTQFWYWFPMTHYVSLTFTPTAVIGVDVDLKVSTRSLFGWSARLYNADVRCTMYCRFLNSTSPQTLVHLYSLTLLLLNHRQRKLLRKLPLPCYLPLPRRRRELNVRKRRRWIRYVVSVWPLFCVLLLTRVRLTG